MESQRLENDQYPGPRWSRERAYWDEAYRLQGHHHGQYLWTKQVEEAAYSKEFFYRLLSPCHHKRILSIGGGVDRLALFLAKAHNHVISVDISPVAAAGTMELARKAGVRDRINCVVANCEELHFIKPFDVIVSKRALHHMNYLRILEAAPRWLVDGGLFIAEEPICLLKLFQWIHKRLPFHPDAVRTADEVELTEDDLALMARSFREVKFYYFDFLTRESLAYFFFKLRAQKLLGPLGKMDYILTNRCFRPLRYLSSYIIIHGVK